MTGKWKGNAESSGAKPGEGDRANRWRNRGGETEDEWGKEMEGRTE